MLRYVARRILLMIPTLFVISALVYFIIDLPPGDCVTSQIDELLSRGDPDALRRADELRQLYGLDQPLWHRYLHWVARHLPLGLRPQLPGHRAGERPDRRAAGAHHRDGDLPPSPSSGSCRSSSASTPPPISTRWATTSPRSSASSASSIPNFLLALVLLYVGKVYFGLSIGGLMDPEYIEKPMSWAKAWSVLQHLVIPVIVIGMSGTAGMIRRLRANLLDELQKQYVVTGRAKGLPPLKLLIKYPLRHAINPFVADIGGLLPEVISGSVIVSVVLSLPTTGPMLLGALKTQDVNLAATFLLFVATLTVVGMLISDLALAALDPRIRFGASSDK